MAIYKQDVVTANGKVVSGEQIYRKPEMRLPYRMADSISDGGHKYIFSRMDGNKAVYTLSSESPNVTLPPDSKASRMSTDNIPTLEQLPPGAILEHDFVGRFRSTSGQTYKLYQPVSKHADKYVYVPA